MGLPPGAVACSRMPASGVGLFYYCWCEIRVGYLPAFLRLAFKGDADLLLLISPVCLTAVCDWLINTKPLVRGVFSGLKNHFHILE